MLFFHYNLNQMYPSPFQNSATPIKDLHYYQGVLMAEVALTLIIFFILKVVHYIKWGYDEEAGEDGEKKQEEKKQGEEQSQSKKWDQKAWNVYFPIIFSFHVGAIALIMVYNPYVFSAVIGFLHFVCFIVMIILNTCIKDVDQKQSRTKGTRVVWGIMCLFNIMLIIGGLAGVSSVYTN